MPLHKEIVKVHISATIDPDIALAIGKYRDDPTNHIDYEKPAKSWIIQNALKKYLRKYLQPNYIPGTPKDLTADLINQAAKNVGCPVKSFGEVDRSNQNQ